jgi:hydrogenase maturation protease
VTTCTALVVCIGNTLVADDAVGYAVFTRLAANPLPSGVRLEYCGVGGVALLELLHGSEELMIVVDAVQCGADAGTVHVFHWDRLPVSDDGNAISSHGIGLKSAITIGQALYPERMPERILLVGIEGRCFGFLGGTMTPEVAAAIQPAVETVHKELTNALHKMH